MEHKGMIVLAAVAVLAAAALAGGVLLYKDGGGEESGKDAAATVSFDTDGTAVEDVSISGGEGPGTMPVSAKEGYSFAGWYADAGLTLQVTDPEGRMLELDGYFENGQWVRKGGVTLYAKWVPQDPNGEPAELRIFRNLSQDDAESFTIGASDGVFTLPASAAELPEGWGKDAAVPVGFTSGTGDAPATYRFGVNVPESAFDGGETAVRVMWADATGTITICRNAAEDDDTKYTLEYDAAAGTIQLPSSAEDLPEGWTNDGHFAVGFSTDLSAGRPGYRFGDSVPVITAASSEDFVLYVTWRGGSPTDKAVLFRNYSPEDKEYLMYTIDYTKGTFTIPLTVTGFVPPEWLYCDLDVAGYSMDRDAWIPDIFFGDEFDLYDTDLVHNHLYCIWGLAGDETRLVQVHRNLDADDDTVFERDVSVYQTGMPLPATIDEYGWSQEDRAALGFSADPADSEARYEFGSTIGNGAIDSAGGRFYVIWDTEDYVKLTLWRNHGDADEETCQAEYGRRGTFTFPAGTEGLPDGWARPGYILAGFSATRGGEAAYALGQTVDVQALVDAKATGIYAVWEETEEVTVHVGNGSDRTFILDVGEELPSFEEIWKEYGTSDGYIPCGFSAGSGSDVAYGFAPDTLSAESLTSPEINLVWAPGAVIGPGLEGWLSGLLRCADAAREGGFDMLPKETITDHYGGQGLTFDEFTTGAGETVSYQPHFTDDEAAAFKGVLTPKWRIDTGCTQVTLEIRDSNAGGSDPVHAEVPLTEEGLDLPGLPEGFSYEGHMAAGFSPAKDASEASYGLCQHIGPEILTSTYMGALYVVWEEVQTVTGKVYRNLDGGDTASKTVSCLTSDEVLELGGIPAKWFKDVHYAAGFARTADASEPEWGLQDTLTLAEAEAMDPLAFYVVWKAYEETRPLILYHDTGYMPTPRMYDAAVADGSLILPRSETVSEFFKEDGQDPVGFVFSKDSETVYPCGAGIPLDELPDDTGLYVVWGLTRTLTIYADSDDKERSIRIDLEEETSLPGFLETFNALGGKGSYPSGFTSASGGEKEFDLEGDMPGRVLDEGLRTIYVAWTPGVVIFSGVEGHEDDYRCMPFGDSDSIYLMGRQEVADTFSYADLAPAGYLGNDGAPLPLEYEMSRHDSTLSGGRFTVAWAPAQGDLNLYISPNFVGCGPEMSILPIGEYYILPSMGEVSLEFRHTGYMPVGLALTADGEVAYDFGKPVKVSDLESSGYRLYVLWDPE